VPFAGELADLRDELVALKAIVGQIIAGLVSDAGGLILGSLGPIRRPPGNPVNRIPRTAACLRGP
jgi:hypothetical protein